MQHWHLLIAVGQQQYQQHSNFKIAAKLQEIQHSHLLIAARQQQKQQNWHHIIAVCKQ